MTGTSTVQNLPFAQLVDAYLLFWNADTAEERDRAAETAFADGVAYRAPIGLLDGTEALTDFRERFVGHMDRAAFRLRGRPQTHHARARLAWEIVTGDGDSFAEGTDILDLGEDGRIRSVTVFLDRAPEGFDPETAAHEPHAAA
ncbi:MULTISPECIES: isomerase [Streptomyces]|uniref:Isomerase n=2 Tax=Streptomyces TaxID=1883 RepID=A0ABS9JJ27_9ACTN|nr:MULTISPECIES: isomerase [Streptomyces]MCG0065586.1 isomerase [Streptomyces tricolor]OYP14495.1 isomerase [Streptomyces sp. FBKL.4005]